MPLAHMTCNHGQRGIVHDGYRVRTPASRMLPTVLDTAERSLGAMAWTLYTSWFTDLWYPNKDALGFAVGRTECDRTEHRFQVTDESQVQSWRQFRRTAPRDLVRSIEAIPGAQPDVWFVSIAVNVPVKYVPITDDERQASRLWTP